MKIAEVLGFGVETQSTTAKDSRTKTLCPFRGTKCTKSSKDEPISVCSLSYANGAAALCPVRLTEGDRMFMEAARIAFGANIPFAIFPEIRLLEIQPEKPGGARSKNWQG